MFFVEDDEIGTIIVKDLSRFGREQVDTLTGDGVEMMPFHNIFIEWYAAQTSKKVPSNVALTNKNTTVSYKVHKRIQHREKDYQTIPNMQEAIISEEQWLRVQELWKHKRRPPRTGRTSLFWGLVYYYDCKAKMHFAAAKSMTRKLEHFRCSRYKSGRGECTMHYIRNTVLEELVLEGVSDLADFARCYELVFLYMLVKKNNAMRQKEFQNLKKAVDSGTKRTVKYEQEQKKLTEEVTESRQTFENAEQKAVDLRLVLRTLRKMTDIKELTPTLVNSLIERIEVHNSDNSSGHSHMKVDIYFTAVGIIDIPTGKEIQAMIEEIQKNPRDFKFVA